MSLLPAFLLPNAHIDLVARAASLEAKLAASNLALAKANAEIATLRAHRARLDNERLALIHEAEAADRRRGAFASPDTETTDD